MIGSFMVTLTPVLFGALLFASTAAAQEYRPNPRPGEERSSNVRLISHLPPVNASGPYTVSDIEMEQELSRPYVYMDRDNSGNRANTTGRASFGFDIISIKDPAKPFVLWSWRIDNPELHRGSGSLAPTYVKTHGRYYFFNGFQFAQGGPDVDLGAIVWDVTGLPDTTTIKEVTRVRVPEHPGGFHETFAYKHSNGMALVVSTTTSAEAYLWDVDKVVSHDPNPVVGKAIIPDYQKIPPNRFPQWHDFYVGYDPGARQDKLYAAGGGGGFVFDITNPAEPRLLASITGVPGITGQHTFTPTPDGRYAVVMPLFEDYYAPARIFDLKPVLDGTLTTLSRPIGAWNASPAGTPHYSEVRWPYVFVAGQTDGFQVVNLMDPTNPYTVGYYSTRPGPYRHGEGITFEDYRTPDGRGNSVYDGAWGVDVRNADGLIVISDFDSGFWAFRMNGFDGWNGHQWGMPNISSAQDWDNGPDGGPKPQRVT
jgi:hypothetical protein